MWFGKSTKTLNTCCTTERLDVFWLSISFAVFLQHWSLVLLLVIDGGIFLVATITATYMLFNCNFYVIWKFHFLFFFFIFIMEWNIAWFSRYFCVTKGWESKLAYYLVWWLDAILTVTKLNIYILYSHKVFLTFMVTLGYLALVLKNCIYL